MTGTWILDRGDFAVQASLMVGGYLAAAVLLSYLPARTKLHHAGRLAASLLIILAALVPILSPFAVIIGTAAAVVLWSVATNLSGPRMAAAHLVVLIAASSLISAQSITNTWVDYWRDDPSAVARIGVYLAAYALVTAPAAYAIAWILNRINLPSNHAPLEGEGEVSSAENPRNHPSSASSSRGRIIGVMERLILLTLALLGQWQAAGLVIAAKSIARFRNLEDRDFAEYYLVGTLASLLIAFLTAAAALALT
jgi:hypothetical protein